MKFWGDEKAMKSHSPSNSKPIDLQSGEKPRVSERERERGKGSDRNSMMGKALFQGMDAHMHEREREFDFLQGWCKSLMCKLGGAGDRFGYFSVWLALICLRKWMQSI